MVGVSAKGDEDIVMDILYSVKQTDTHVLQKECLGIDVQQVLHVCKTCVAEGMPGYRCIAAAACL